jgi:hypothetical protein
LFLILGNNWFNWLKLAVLLLISSYLTLLLLESSIMWGESGIIQRPGRESNT